MNSPIPQNMNSISTVNPAVSLGSMPTMGIHIAGRIIGRVTSSTISM